MSVLRRSLSWRFVLAGCSLVIAGAVPLVADKAGVPTAAPADRYVESLSRRLALRDEPCTGLATNLKGRLRCGRTSEQSIATGAHHEEAFRLAEASVADRNHFTRRRERAVDRAS